MSRYGGYGNVVIEFMDGTTQRVGGTDHRIRDGQLLVFQTSDHGSDRDTRYFPLANIKSWHWEER